MRSHHHLRQIVQIGLLGSLAIAPLSAPVAQSIQLTDGSIFFTQIPRLPGASTTVNSTAYFGADYRFYLEIPEDAGEPLQQVVFAQTSGVDPISFLHPQTRAYRNRDRRDSISVGDSFTDDDGMVVVRFDPPVQPGQLVTISLRSRRNPIVSGVYQFGVTASPPVPRPRGNSSATAAYTFTGLTWAGKLRFPRWVRWAHQQGFQLAAGPIAVGKPQTAGDQLFSHLRSTFLTGRPPTLIGYRISRMLGKAAGGVGKAGKGLNGFSD